MASTSSIVPKRKRRNTASKLITFLNNTDLVVLRLAGTFLLLWAIYQVVRYAFMH